MKYHVDLHVMVDGNKSVKEGHDIAALKIITEEAGGKVTDLNGRERRYDSDGCGCIVSNGVLHDKILEIVKKSKLESN